MRKIGAKTMKIILLLIISSLLASNVFAGWPDNEPDCLAANIYFEARSESLVGQYMVGYVTTNRLKSTRYPNTICGVVKQYKQFSWYNPNKEKFPKDQDAWDRACSIAIQFLLEKPVSKIDLSEGALYYHANYVSPSWRLVKTYIGKVGSHLFYR